MNTKIEWTDKSWNPMHGCTQLSAACENCYALTMARRLQGNHVKGYENGFKVTLHPDKLNEPYKWKKPSMVFVCSMGDLFHEDVPYSYISQVMKVIRDNQQHTFQLLTKRAENMWHYFFTHTNIPSNVWLGVTCESPNHYDRIEALKDIKSENVKFVSCEPLLDDVYDMPLEGIDWVIAGGESGVKARASNPVWFRLLQMHCEANHVPFFFKQWGTWGSDGVRRSKKANGRLLDGEEWNQYPTVQKRI